VLAAPWPRGTAPMGSSGREEPQRLTVLPRSARFVPMDRQTALDRLRREKPALQAMGLKGVSLFGSTARGNAADGSDLDLAVTLDEAQGIDLFRFAAMTENVSRLLGLPVDLVVEPARNLRIQAEIDRDRVRAY
jgi:uncharacterized protein